MATPVTNRGGTIDPRQSDDAAAAWTQQVLEWQAKQESDLGRWYVALIEQVGVGIVSCDALQHYNQAAEAFYYDQANIWEWFDPLWSLLRSKGLSVPQYPPLPKLIGTVYNVYGGALPSTKKFQVSVPCSPDGMADVSKILAYGQPANCTRVSMEPMPGIPVGPTASSGTSGNEGLGAAFAVCAAGPYAAIGCGVVAAAAIGIGYFTVEALRTVRDIVGTLDGSTIARINQKMYDTRTAQNAKRAEFITDCIRQRMSRMLGSGPLTFAQKAQIQQECTATGQAAYPDTAPPYGKGLGVFGTIAIVVGVGAAVGITALIVTRNKRDDRPSKRS